MVDIPIIPVITIYPNLNFVFYIVAGINLTIIFTTIIAMLSHKRRLTAGTDSVLRGLLESQLRTVQSLETFRVGMDEHMKLIGGLQETVSAMHKAAKAMEDETHRRTKEPHAKHHEQSHETAGTVTEAVERPNISERVHEIYKKSLNREKIVLIKLLADTEADVLSLEKEIEEGRSVDMVHVKKVSGELTHLQAKLQDYYRREKGFLSRFNNN